MDEVVIHTDGGCRGNPGPGAHAAVLRWADGEKEVVGTDPHTTNNRMELLAAISALEALEEPCRVTMITDSEYVKRGITEWLPRWIQRIHRFNTVGNTGNLRARRRHDRSIVTQASGSAGVRGNAALRRASGCGT